MTASATDVPPVLEKVAPADGADSAPLRGGLFAWGNHLVWLGTFGLLFIVFVTALIQFWALLTEGMDSTLYYWIQTRYPDGVWDSGSMNFAIFAVNGGCLFLLPAGLVVFLGLALSFFSVRRSAWKWLTPFAGILLGLSVVVAVSFPFALQIVYRHYEKTYADEDLHMAMVFTTKAILMSASVGSVLAASCFLLYQLGIVRKLGRYRLGWNVLGLLFFIVLSAGLLWALDFVGTRVTDDALTENIEERIALQQHRALFNYVGFLLWCVAAVIGLVWFLISNLFVNRAVPRPLPRRDSD